jgi:hypothetical protein
VCFVPVCPFKDAQWIDILLVLLFKEAVDELPELYAGKQSANANISFSSTETLLSRTRVPASRSWILVVRTWVLNFVCLSSAVRHAVVVVFSALASG